MLFLIELEYDNCRMSISSISEIVTLFKKWIILFHIEIFLIKIIYIRELIFSLINSQWKI